MCAEDNSRSSIGNSCYSSVDNSTLFHGCTQLADRHATCSEGFSSESNSSSSGQSPSTSSTTGVAGMQIIRQSLQSSEISPDIVEVIMQSWRDNTHKQYKVYINKWVQFCGVSILPWPNTLSRINLAKSLVMFALTSIPCRNFVFMKHWATIIRPLRNWEILPNCLFHSLSRIGQWPRPPLGVVLRLY